VPLSVGELGSYLTHCDLGRDLPVYQVATSSIQAFGHNRHRPKSEAAVLLFVGRGSWVPSNNVTWAEAYLRTKWYLDISNPLATTDMGRKFGGAESPSDTM